MFPARRSLSDHAVSLTLLALPVAVLGAVAARSQSVSLAIGALAVTLAAALCVRERAVWRPPVSGTVIILYLLALGWLWVATHETADRFARVGRGLFLFVAVGLLAVHDLTRTGVEPRRRARRLNHRLQTRARWPRTPAEFLDLPEVKALRVVARDDPALVFELLEDRRAEVQMAGMAALQGRPYWRWAEAAVVLRVARGPVPGEVRVLAVSALASGTTLDLLDGVCEFLRDPLPDVRAEAVAALLRGGEGRWAVVRGAMRRMLADPVFASDGALPGAAGRLSPLAVCDLTGWAAEPQPLGERAVRTLVDHYHTLLAGGGLPALPSELGRLVTDSATPGVLRVELAALLRAARLLPPDLLDRMTDADQPSAVRLLAVEIILAQDPTDSSAADVLKGLGRHPNRESALVIARLLQRYLRIDFGLPPNGASPSSKLAAEVTQKVTRWANERGDARGIEETPIPLGEAVAGAGGVFGPKSAPGMSPPRHRWGG